MSVDKNVSEELMELLQDSTDGFTSAAERLANDDHAALAERFRRYATQRKEFYSELERLAAAYGDDLEESGSVKAAAHRVWMSVKDTLAGSNVDGILGAAASGEDYAMKTYGEALDQDISEGLRSVVVRQHGEVMAAHAEIKTLHSTSA